MLIFLLMSLVPPPAATGGAEGLFLLFFSQMIPENSIGTILVGWRILDFYFLGLFSLLLISLESLLPTSALLTSIESNEKPEQ